MHLEDNINKRRTFAIIAHPDAGKTTLTKNRIKIATNIYPSFCLSDSIDIIY